jgi:hypothetical protein
MIPSGMVERGEGGKLSETEHEQAKAYLREFQPCENAISKRSAKNVRERPKDSPDENPS